MGTQLKRKIAFALVMGVVTTGIISFVLLALNLGFSDTSPWRGCDRGASPTSSSFRPSWGSDRRYRRDWTA